MNDKKGSFKLLKSRVVGFQVFFPKVLCNDMKLTDKFEVISINKITYEDSQKVQPNMLKAIDDETMFNTLTAYNPTRGVGAQLHMHFSGLQMESVTQ